MGSHLAIGSVLLALFLIPSVIQALLFAGLFFNKSTKSSFPIRSYLGMLSIFISLYNGCRTQRKFRIYILLASTAYLS